MNSLLFIIPKTSIEMEKARVKFDDTLLDDTLGDTFDDTFADTFNEHTSFNYPLMTLLMAFHCC